MPNTFTIEGTLKDTQNVAMASKYVYFRLTSVGTDVEDNVTYPKDTVEFQTDASGNFSGTLWVNGDSGVSSTYEIILPTQKQRVEVVIPSAVEGTTVRLEDIIELYQVDADTQQSTVQASATAYTDTAMADPSDNASFGKAAWLADLGLTDIEGLTPTDGNVIVGDGTNWVAESGATARTSLGLGAADAVSHGSLTLTTDLALTEGGTGASTAAAARTNLGVAIGTDVQAYDAQLADIAALAVTDGNIIVGDGTNWVAESGATARTSLGVDTLVDGYFADPSTNGSFSASTWRTDLGLGTAATTASSDYEDAGAAQNRARLPSVQAATSTSGLSLPDDPTLDVGFGDFSLVAWVRFPSTLTSTQYVMEKFGEGTGYAIYVTSSGVIAAYFGGTYPALTGVDLRDNRWHCLIATFDRDDVLTWYVDGVAVDTDDISAKFADNLDNTGNFLALDGFGSASMDEGYASQYIALTKDVITATEAASISVDPTQVLALDNLAAAIDLGNPYEGTFTDLSTNNATVTINGSINYQGKVDAPYSSGGTDVAVADGGTGASTASAARTNLGLVIGTDVQAYDAGLASIAGLTTAADKMIYTTASDTYAAIDLTAAGRALLDDADAAAQRTTLGMLSASATLDFPSIGANADEELTITVTGATVGDAVQLAAPAAIEDNLLWSGYVSATNTVTVRLANIDGASIDPASATWGVIVTPLS